VNQRGQELCSQSYGTRSVPTTLNVHLFLESTTNCSSVLVYRQGQIHCYMILRLTGIGMSFIIIFGASLGAPLGLTDESMIFAFHAPRFTLSTAAN